jgi:hypothetical protein
MSKTKFILGIMITVLGGLVMLVSMVFGIIHIAGSLYRNSQVLDVNLKTVNVTQKTRPFEIKKGQIISVWLKYPDRQLENKDFKIGLSFVNAKEVASGEMGEDFNAGYSRNSAGNGQYYWLGKHGFQDNFKGCLQYKVNGTYVPVETGKLVLRESLPLSLPLKHILFFIAGIFTLIIGIGTIAKNSRKLESA